MRTENISRYHQLVNKAELAICQDNFSNAYLFYREAFNHIDKPFGKDLFNAAIVAGKQNDQKMLSEYLQKLVNNLEDFDHLKSVFVKTYISEEEWETLLSNRKVDFDPEFKKEVREVFYRDQMYRGNYDVQDSNLYNNLIINLKWILAKTRESKFPAQQELGYKSMFIGQEHHLVLHHATQRRSYDKSLIDLEPLLLQAVLTGRLDPELAIQYMIFQNDDLRFKNLTVWQYEHGLLPDSLKTIYWSPKKTDNAKEIDSVRNSWHACSMADAERKVEYLSENLSSSFIFTSVNKAEGNIDESLNKNDAFDTYKLLTKDKKPFHIKKQEFND